MLAAALAAGALYGGYRLEASLEERAKIAAGTRVEVHPGASLRAVLGELARVGGVPHPRLVEWNLRLHGQSLRALVGTYELVPGESVREILAQLNAGQVVMEQLTIVEGWTFAQMRRALHARNAVTHEWREPDEAPLMAAPGEPGVGGAGRVLPLPLRLAPGTLDPRRSDRA